MKIAYLVTDPNIDLDKPTGPTAHILGTIDGFRAHGIEVVLFQNTQCQNPPKRVVATIVKNAETAANRGMLRRWGSDFKRLVKHFSLTPDCIKQINEFQPDAIYERSWLFSLGGVRFSRQRGVYHLLETSGCAAEITHDSYGISSVQLANRVEQWKLSHVDSVVVESRAAVETVRRKFGLSNPVIAKPLGFHAVADNGDLVPEERVASFCRRFEQVVAFVGTFGSYQGTHLLMQAIEEAQRMQLSIGFVLIGAGGNQKECEAIAAEKGLDNVLFTGMLQNQELPAAISMANAGIIPDCVSHMAPIKALQYGVLGIPCLVPSYPCFHGLVDHERQGLLFKPKNIPSMVDAITSLPEIKSHLPDWGMSLRKRIIEEYSWKAVVTDVVNQLRNGI